MFFQVLSSILFLPFLVMSMIIAQVHLEGYWDSKITKWRGRQWSVFYIIFVYIVQEICIMELTLLNLNIMAFIYVIPITMILRNKHQIWCGLCALTPVLAWMLDAYLKRYQFINLGATLLQLALIGLVCWSVLHNKRLSYYYKYTIALYSNCFIHMLRLYLEHQLQLDFTVSILAGTFFIIIAENSRMYYEQKQKEEIEKLHYESVRDDLTGLLNYRAFDEEMQGLSKDESNMPIFIAVLDIDHFKQVNDTYGHLNGNTILSTFSKKLKLDIHHNFDPHCAVYRFGGEEFTILIKAKDNTKIIKILDSINKYYSKHPVITDEGQKIFFSFSGGLTEHHNNEKFTKTLERADELVYQAKKTGRAKILIG